uniref:Uncharacterized protein AlNc14C67G4739 n=1 Tax=Albugo laibachii Nc14 TaxID=890382 RepID=F0WDL9_9STRA|nr:conserved hypothetical protein [Albugo laibachii Nc14]|eukprot:CCA19294.1 conserved hypothetical protein [Albugo laibachii Nc14]
MCRLLASHSRNHLILKFFLLLLQSTTHAIAHSTPSSEYEMVFDDMNRMRHQLHHYFQLDASGNMEAKELQSVISKTTNADDIDRVYEKLDRNQDSLISKKELEQRWELIGAEMTVQEVADWIAYSVQLPQYADLFRYHSISGYTFPLLMKDEGEQLRQIGIESELHRHQVAMFLRMRYLGLGAKPEKIVRATCDYEQPQADLAMKHAFARITWTSASEASPERFQLQKRSPGSAFWTPVYSGPDTEFVDLLQPNEKHVTYRLATWNSYGRSPHVFVHCMSSSQPIQSVSETVCAYDTLGDVNCGSSASTKREIAKSKAETLEDTEPYSLLGFFAWIKATLWWLDEAIALAIFIVLPIRGFIYGDVNFFLRILHRLPPQMPTRVVVEATDKQERSQEAAKLSLKEVAVIVSWEKPADNGVPIVCYTVRWTRSKNDQMQWLKLMTLPLPTTARIEHLRRGETYKFTVEATNAFGLISRSSRSTYMVPVSQSKGKLYSNQKLLKEASSKVLRNQCFICHAPSRMEQGMSVESSDDEQPQKIDSFDSFKKSDSCSALGSEKEQHKQKRRFLLRKSTSSSINGSRVSLRNSINRKILHFCCRCDREFCHFHRGIVFHTKALSCPAVDGRCVCVDCAKVDDFHVD